MPRPRLGTVPLVKLTIMVEPKTVEGIDRLMAKMQASLRSVRVDRSTAAREALTLGLEQAGCAERGDRPSHSPEAPPAAPKAKPSRAKRPARKAVSDGA